MNTSRKIQLCLMKSTNGEQSESPILWLYVVLQSHGPSSKNKKKENAKQRYECPIAYERRKQHKTFLRRTGIRKKGFKDFYGFFFYEGVDDNVPEE